MTATNLPLNGIRVIEFSHMVMGPSAGLVLADLGADVIKVEPLGGDKTRELRGSGAGYFVMYNRNKRSIRIDLKSERGNALARELVGGADVVIENFRPGAMEKLGLGYDALSGEHPALIYCSNRGFLSGPYEHRTALDEVAQMMGGLAYMTGPPGRPLRAGASVIDVMGGLFGALGILAALAQRHDCGRGQHVTSSLFETSVFLVGQHIAQFAVTGTPAAPMPARVSAWAIYDVFDTQDDEKVFVGVVSDSQWRTFCEAFGFDELAADDSLKLNNDRVAARDRIMPVVQQAFRSMSRRQLMQTLESSGLPFAPINKPEDLLDDPHLTASGGLLDVSVPGGDTTRLPALPLSMDEQRFGVERQPPGSGEHTRDVLREAGYTDPEIEQLIADRIVSAGDD
ncbi:MAG: CaiB/BaiF CoA-transferase family protein [Woeseiaceae bacterium]|nr:CaiB/BaiF CoA-transferase family protein [Woeseiaceae bacterium]